VVEIFSAGLVSGLSVNIGGEGTSVSVVIKGVQIYNKFIKIGGNTITSSMLNTLHGVLAMSDIIKIKDMCYCALDVKEQTETLNSKKDNKISITLINGVQNLAEELFLITECLWESEDASIQKVIAQTINECNYPDKKLLWGNIVLCGMTSLITGLKERLLKELKKLAPTSTPVKIIAAPDRDRAACIGASMLLSSVSFYDQLDQFILHAYDEHDFSKEHYRDLVINKPIH